MTTRTAILGLGDAGFNMHLPAIRSLDGLSIAGVADPDEARRNRAAAAHGVRAFASWQELLEREHPDLVVVATPPDTHVELCLAAIASGADVICEKPLTVRSSDATSIIEAARRAGRSVAVNHEFRLMPIFRGVLEAVAADGRDRVNLVQAWQQVDLAPASADGWRLERNRMLHEAGVHLIDFAMAAYGSSPEEVWPGLSDGGSGLAGNSDAVAAITLRFPGGRFANLVMNRLSRGENHYFDARVDTASASYRAAFGGRARLTAGLHRGPQPHIRFDFGASGLAWRETGQKRAVIARNPSNPRMIATRELVSRSLSAFAAGTAAPCTPDWARQVTAVIEAAYQSAESGRLERVGTWPP